jgi:Tol biopolymer transport system component
MIPVGGGAIEKRQISGPDAPPSTESFSWLPDGSGIITSADVTEGSGYLLHLDLASGKVRPVTAGTMSEMFPALSADGKKLLYSGGVAGYDIVEIPLDGSAVRDVIATSRGEVAPSLTADGLRLGYITNRAGTDEIWLRNRQDDSERLIFQPPPGVGSRPILLDSAVAPDGARIAYRQMFRGAFDIWIAPVSGEAPVRLWNDPKHAPQRGPFWSPDGNWVAYYSTLDGRSAVLKIRIGSNTPELIAFTGLSRPVRWSPGNDWILWQDTTGLRLVSPDGKRDSIVSGREWLTYGWSRDGRTIYGIAENGRRLVVGRIDPATKAETILGDLGQTPPGIRFADYNANFPFRGFSMSADGKSFVTSIYRAKMDLWLTDGISRRTRLVDLLWPR